MYEGATEINISLIHRVKVAFEWAIKYFAIIVFAVLVSAATIFIILLIVDKMEIINAVRNKLNE
jgi:hypothetical protein